MKKYTLYLLTSVCLILVSCNSDIFLDRNLDLPRQTVFYIDGDDGSMSLKYSSKGLENIYIDISDTENLNYFNSKGNVIAMDSPASEIKEIAYIDQFCEFSVGVTGHELYFSSYQNCTGHEVIFPLRLVYDHEEKYITIHVMPGEPLGMSNWHYDDGCEMTENFHVDTRNITYNNNGPEEVTVQIEPYSNIPVRARVIPASDWASGLEVSLPLPMYYKSADDDDDDGDGWIFVDCGEFKTNTMVSYPCNRHVVKRLTLKPYSTTRISISVIYFKAEFKGTVTFTAPVFDHDHVTSFTCEVVEPMDYDIKVTEI